MKNIILALIASTVWISAMSHADTNDYYNQYQATHQVCATDCNEYGCITNCHA